jgi:hypothetical protein
MWTLTTRSLLLVCLAGLAGCEPDSSRTPDTPTLPVSLNEVMVALVNQAADPIWIAAWRDPETDADWRRLQRMAYQLQLAGALLVIPGTGPRDHEWAADDRWISWAGKLEAAGQRAVAAVDSRDSTRIARSGDELVDVCEGCHIDFKPEKPTGGVFGELSPTATDFDDGEP